MDEFLLLKLATLRLDCRRTHQRVEEKLLTGGICKRYTQDSTSSPASTTWRAGGTRRWHSLPASVPDTDTLFPTSFPTGSDSPCSSAWSVDRPFLCRRRRRRGRIQAGQKTWARPWRPRTTIPQPFQMTIREATEIRRTT